MGVGTVQESSYQPGRHTPGFLLLPVAAFYQATKVRPALTRVYKLLSVALAGIAFGSGRPFGSSLQSKRPRPVAVVSLKPFSYVLFPCVVSFAFGGSGSAASLWRGCRVLLVVCLPSVCFAVWPAGSGVAPLAGARWPLLLSGSVSQGFHIALLTTR